VGSPSVRLAPHAAAETIDTSATEATFMNLDFIFCSSFVPVVP
jgi:hypothetical protein